MKNEKIKSKYYDLTQQFKSQNPNTPLKKSSGDEIIIKTTDEDEFNKKKLEKQQTKYLNGQWKAVQTQIKQRSLIYESQRYPIYLDYDLMVQYPIIGAAVDLMAEEATTPNSKGVILNIYSESDRVQEELNDLFNNRLNIHTNLVMWIRNMPVRDNSVIPLLNGENVEIKDLAERVKNGEELWTYSVQDKTKKIVAGKIVWCDLTKEKTKVVRVTLDDNTYVDTTPDHEFILRDGSQIPASQLKKGDSLMPFYTKISNKKSDSLKGYEKVYNPASNYHKFTHRVVSEEIRDLEIEKGINEIIETHHVDFNKKNNNPNNLLRLTRSEHRKLHLKHMDKTIMRPDVIAKRYKSLQKYLRSDKRKKYLSSKMKGIYPEAFKKYNNSALHSSHNNLRSYKMKKKWGTESFTQKVKQSMSIKFNYECFNRIKEVILDKPEFCLSKKKLSDCLKNDVVFVKEFTNCNQDTRRNIIKAINRNTLITLIEKHIGKTYYNFCLELHPQLKNNNKFKKSVAISKGKSKIINHKVISVVELEEISDVYCMEVRGFDNGHDRHNFPICSRNNDGEYTRNGVFVSNCKYGDNFLHLQLDDEYGVIGAKQLPNIEIERIEGNYLSALRGISSDLGSDEVLFRWKSEYVAEFKEWQIAHFRLLMDDRRLPYGVSMLENARRIWKNILLVEDAMRAVRLLRAIDRRVYYIDVGNIDHQDVNAFVDKIANRFRRKRHVDPNTGQEDLKYYVISYDQDIFIPKRGSSDNTKVETLQGASNLDQISDIEYDFAQLVTALRVPKAFLNYDEATGDGKNLAMQDIRFARTVNRIQQAALQELNKIAIIHLHLLGLEDELHNFKLSLNNPSIQSKIMEIELMQSQFDAYKSAVADAGNGFAIMSRQRASKNILEMTNDEIILDNEQQFLEKAAAAELEQAPDFIKDTTLFSKIKKLYGEIGGVETISNDEEGDEEFGEGGLDGGTGGGFDAGGLDDAGEIDFEDEGGEDLEDVGEGGDETETPDDLGDVQESKTFTNKSFIKGIDIGKISLLMEKAKNQK